MDRTLPDDAAGFIQSDTAPAARYTANPSSSTSRPGATASSSHDGHDLTAAANALVRWTDVKKSALVFAAGNLFFVLLLRHEWSLMQLVASTMLLLLGVAFVLARVLHWNVFAPLTNENFQLISEQSAADVAKQLTALGNAAVRSAAGVLTFATPRDSFNVAVALLIVAVLGRFVSTLAWLYVGFIVAFVWPTLYRYQAPLIDDLFERAQVAVKSLIDRGMASVPRYTTRRAKND